MGGGATLVVVVEGGGGESGEREVEEVRVGVGRSGSGEREGWRR